MFGSTTKEGQQAEHTAIGSECAAEPGDRETCPRRRDEMRASASTTKTLFRLVPVAALYRGQRLRPTATPRSDEGGYELRTDV